jgi:hypothetical protein
LYGSFLHVTGIKCPCCPPLKVTKTQKTRIGGKESGLLKAGPEKDKGITPQISIFRGLRDLKGFGGRKEAQ